MTRKELIEELLDILRSPNDPAVHTRHHATVWQKKPYTAVEVGLWYGCEYYCDRDFAKVQYPDEWDADYGRELVMRKACASIARRILTGE